MKQFHYFGLYIVTWYFLSIFHVQAQQVLIVSGGNAIGTGGNFSYAVGQLVYTTNQNSIGSVVQGIQQPYEVFITSIQTSTKTIKSVTLNCSIAPNPTFGNLIFKISDLGNLQLNAIVYDSKGVIHDNTKITECSTIIRLDNKAKGVYFLKLQDTTNDSKTRIYNVFKIIKK